MEARESVFVARYPGFGRRLLYRVRDIPWRVSVVREWLSKSSFGEVYDAVRPYTMVSYPRLRALYNAVSCVVREDVPGDLVECGTARGGSAALMGLASKRMASKRTLWVYDTFEGLPPPTHDDPDYEIARDLVGECRGSLEEVTGLLRRLEIEPFRCVKGLFDDTLPTAEVQRIAVLHIDADWYRSVMTCLETLWDRVSPGGVIQIDDYGHWAGARKAVDEFFARRNIRTRLRYLDYTGRQAIKE